MFSRLFMISLATLILTMVSIHWQPALADQLQNEQWPAGYELPVQISSKHTSDLNWSALGEGLNDWVWAMAVDGSDAVYAGGIFTDTSDALCSGCNYIAMWDGSNWSALGQGLNGKVEALSLDDDGNLYAGGSFDNTFDGSCSACNRIAMWDGTNWNSLGEGISSGSVLDLAIDNNGNLYAGGSFVACSGACLNVSKWDGISWAAVGEIGVSQIGTVYALAFDGNHTLYAGGRFSEQATLICTGCNNIAMWDGSTWSPLGQGLGEDQSDTVYAIAFDESDNLYAAGHFSSAYGGDCDGCNHIAMWDGSAWNALDDGLGSGGSVKALLFDSNGALIAGGYFNPIFGNACCNHVAYWNGATWTALNQELAGLVETITIDSSGALIAGGFFTDTTDNSCSTCNYIAKLVGGADDGLTWRSYLPFIFR